MKRFVRWLFEDAFVVSVHGRQYVPDWDAIGAIASTLAFLSAVAAIYYSVKLVHRQLREQDRQERDRVERERILELKRLEREHLTRILDLADRTFHRLHELAARILATAMGKQGGLSVETTNAPVEASREYAAITGAILSIVKASRAHRFPPNVHDVVFDRYEKLTRAVVTNNSNLVKVIVEHPQGAPQLMQSSDAEAVFSMNQLLKTCTGKLIALMFGRVDEWNARDFVDFVDQFLEKSPADAEPPTVGDSVSAQSG